MGKEIELATLNNFGSSCSSTRDAIASDRSPYLGESPNQFVLFFLAGGKSEHERIEHRYGSKLSAGSKQVGHVCCTIHTARPISIHKSQYDPISQYDDNYMIIMNHD